MTNDNGLPWHIVEAAIYKEKQWLLQMMDFGQSRNDVLQKDPTHSTSISADEMLRHLSISIVRGYIRARQYTSKEMNGLWTDNKIRLALENSSERHGGEWHRAMLALIKRHFLDQGYTVSNEPSLMYGRADLGAYKKDHQNIYIEVGSTSLYKTWINMHATPDCIFLFVPTVYCALEFSTLDKMPSPFPKE
ncbi:MAG TPA: hypothetical protein VJH69_02735 [Candidatus Paceibacterota bacterium]